jgi:hypothetical protein
MQQSPDPDLNAINLDTERCMRVFTATVPICRPDPEPVPAVAEDEDSDIEILPAQGTVPFLNYRPSSVVFGSGIFFWARRISGTGIR